MAWFNLTAIGLGVVVVSAAWAWLALLAMKQLVYQEVRRERREARWLTASSVPLIWLIGLIGLASALVVGVVLRRPILGPILLGATPWVVLGVLRVRKARKRRLLEEEMVTFLHGLRGLTRAGLAMPSALFHLSNSLPGELPRVIGYFLSDYERGRSLAVCLERFRVQVGLRFSSVPLALLGLAYRQGLSIGPVLDQALPGLEADLERQHRSTQLRRAALAQGCLAALLPWGLLLVLRVFQPEVIANFFASALAFPVVAIALAWEGLGFLAIRRMAC